ncbi:MAG: hypothetical protein IJ736_16840 [Firmicutes bacterium]|nr:hypothetical protein [Bacillota bacterium]
MKKESNSIEEIKYELKKLSDKSNTRTIILVIIGLILVGTAIAVIVYKLRSKLCCNCVAEGLDEDEFDDDDYIDYSDDDDEDFVDYRAADFEGQEED